MKIQFYSEGLTRNFERFTFIGIQWCKADDGIYYLVIWFVGFGISIIFN